MPRGSTAANKIISEIRGEKNDRAVGVLNNENKTLVLLNQLPTFQGVSGSRGNYRVPERKGSLKSLRSVKGLIKNEKGGR